MILVSLLTSVAIFGLLTMLTAKVCEREGLSYLTTTGLGMLAGIVGVVLSDLAKALIVG